MKIKQIGFVMIVFGLVSGTISLLKVIWLLIWASIIVTLLGIVLYVRNR